jgi:hypothetical protein
VYFSTEMVQGLGLAEEVLPKSRRILSERVGSVVARGEAELGLQQLSELLPIPGIELLGPLPPEVQRVTVFAAGVAAASREPEAARDLIRFLASPAAAEAVQATGPSTRRPASRSARTRAGGRPPTAALPSRKATGRRPRPGYRATRPGPGGRCRGTVVVRARAAGDRGARSLASEPADA